MKKGDYVVVLLIFLISVTIFYISKTNLSTSSDSNLIVNVNGEIVERQKLNSEFGEKEFVVESEFGKNVIVVEDNSVYIKDSDCKDKTCIKMGKISKVGQSLVCLPNRLIITIEGNSDVDVVLQ